MVIAPGLSEHVLCPGFTDQQCSGSAVPRHNRSAPSRYREDRDGGAMVEARCYEIEGQWFV